MEQVLVGRLLWLSRRISSALANENLKRFVLIMAGSNILTRKQLDKMSNKQLIDFAIKVQKNLISKQNALSNENKEINAKLQNIDKKVDELNKENNLLLSRLSVAENTSTLLSRNHHKNSEKIINLERDLHKMEQYSRQECIKNS